MTDVEHPRASGPPPGPSLPTHTLTIPPTVSMVSLLGPRDEVLHAIEAAVPDLDVHVRGNEIALRGATSDVRLVERLIDELVLIVGAGQPLARDAVERAVAMLRGLLRSGPRTC